MQEKTPIDPTDPPFLTGEVAPIAGRARESLDDFRVEEIPAYPPSGEGEHLFVRFEKRGLTTPQAVGRLADALGVPSRDAGWAGLKDRHAVTVQWASLPGCEPDAARAVQIEGVRVLEAIPHGRKLRTGHLRGNRFELRLRGVAPERIADAQHVLDRLAAEGIPNYYGPQRFGREGSNLPRARAWLVDGGAAPRQRFDRKLLVSVLQSALFNTVLAERVRAGELSHAVEGDLLKAEPRGRLYVARDREEADRALARWEASPTGPMFGPRMRWPEAEAGRREQAVLDASGLDRQALTRFGRIGRGTRRPLRVPLGEPHLRPGQEPGTVELSFELPKGSYATVVLREVLKAEGA